MSLSFSSLSCILVLSHYTPKGKCQGGGLLFASTRVCIQCTPTMANSLIVDYLPFANVADNVMLDRNRSQNIYRDINNLSSPNTNVLNDIDPDINNLIPNGLKHQCKGYDTSSELRNDICFQNNTTMCHTNICSSSNNLKVLMYYIDTLNITFTFIGLSETWATESNQNLHEMPGYEHEQCIRSNKNRGGYTRLYIHNSIQYRRRGEFAFPQKPV